MIAMCNGKHGRLIMSIMRGEDYLAKCLSSSFALMKSGYTRKSHIASICRRASNSKRKKRQIMIAEKWQTASAEKLSDQADNGQDFIK